jgi:hypothetical protein
MVPVGEPVELRKNESQLPTVYLSIDLSEYQDRPAG